MSDLDISKHFERGGSRAIYVVLFVLTSMLMTGRVEGALEEFTFLFLWTPLVGIGIGGLFYPFPILVRRIERTGQVALGLGGACVVGLFILTNGSGEFQVRTPAGDSVYTIEEDEVYTPEVSATSDTIGPFFFDERRAVDVEVEQSLKQGGGQSYRRWSFVTVELLDSKKEYLASFGGEFWNYAGVDNSGYDWRDINEQYETLLWMPARTYYMRVQTETNVAADTLAPAKLRISPRGWRGNPYPMMWLGFVAVCLAGMFLFAPFFQRKAMIEAHLQEGNQVRFDNRAWTVGEKIDYEYDDADADVWSMQAVDSDNPVVRYLEHEYEDDSSWEMWLWTRLLELDAISCPDAEEQEISISRYVSTHEELPDTIIFEERVYALSEQGTVHRKGVSVPFHTYEDDAGDFVTIEGDPSRTLEATANTEIRPTDLLIVAGAS